MTVLCNYITASLFTQIRNKIIMEHMNFSRLTKKIIVVVSASLLMSLSIFAQSGSSSKLFNSNLSSSELKNFNDYKTVIKNTGKVKKICLASNNYIAQKAISTIKDLDPTYLVEIIRKYPYKGNEDLIEKLDEIIMDIPSYAGIPYWSEQHNRYFDLYTTASISSIKEDSSGRTVLADLYMKPFGNINTQMLIKQTEETYYYEATNLNKLRYSDKISAVKPKKQKSVIVVFRQDDDWILYALGGVDAPSVPFLSGRIETSFINRIKTFCTYCFTKLDSSL